MQRSAQLAHCRERAFYAFGTAKIFERRMQLLNRRRTWITYLGIVIPVLVGAVALSFGTEWAAYTLVPAGILGTLQLALSVWSLSAKWDEKYSYAISAAQAQTKLFNSWEALAKRQPTDLDQQLMALDTEDQRLEAADIAQHISDAEKRYAMHASLYHFGQACVRCKRIPASMKPEMCDTCGNY